MGGGVAESIGTLGFWAPQQPPQGVWEKQVLGCDLPLHKGGEGSAKLPFVLSLSCPVQSDGGTRALTPAVPQDRVVLPKQ